MRCALILPLFAMLASASVARADLPTPFMCYVDPCVVVCPAGDSIFTVVSRDALGNPIAGADVAVDFSYCANVHPLPSIPPGQYQVQPGSVVIQVADPFGRALIPIAAGGACTATQVRVYTSGYLLGSRPVASFDLDGDFVVTEADLALVNDRLGTTDRAADYNCDSTVTPSDYQIASMHLGHAHPSVLDVAPWVNVEFGVTPATNPTAGATEFAVRSPWHGRAVLALYDLSGRRLATVLDRELEAGTVVRATWSGRDSGGRRAAPGIYFYRLTIGSERAQGTLIVAR